jgi:hypothetical protein
MFWVWQVALAGGHAADANPASTGMLAANDDQACRAVFSARRR